MNAVPNVQFLIGYVYKLSELKICFNPNNVNLYFQVQLQESFGSLFPLANLGLLLSKPHWYNKI